MKHNWRITLILIGTFLIAQLIGLLIVQNYVDVEKTAETGQLTYEALPLGLERPQVEEQNSYIYILSAVLIGTLLLFVLIRFKVHLLWKLWYGVAVFFTLTIALGAFLPYGVSAALALVLALLKVLRPSVIIHNVTEVFVYGGLAAIFVPVMNVFAGTIVLLVMSAYDAYAVWKSKHMITLAKFQAQSKMFAGLFIPYQLKGRVGTLTPKSKHKTKGIQSAILGGGDIALPLLFAGAVAKVAGFGPALLISLGAAAGLFVLLMIGKKDHFYPAMPFISLGCFLGYGLGLLW
jgi:presenilin-like A22 family membrane protease